MADRTTQLVFIALAAIAATAIAWVLVEQRQGPEALEIDLPEAAGAGPLEVYITGAVAEPGVYEVEEGDRVVDVLFEAGGHTDDADLEAVNLALRLEDEDQITIPRRGEVAGVTTSSGPSSALININTATASELDELPGIGEVYSERIVVSREQDGPYGSVEELIERDIIPRGTFEGIQALITTGP